MSRHISSRLADKLLAQKECCHYDREVYIYGIELIISTLAGLISIIGVSKLYSDTILGVVFIIFFVPLRLFTGGYHAKTVFWFFLLLVADFYISKNAPMINRNQEISPQKRQMSKTIARKIVFVEGVLILLLAIVDKRIMSMAVLSVWLVVNFMLLANKYFQKGVERS